MRAVRLTQVGKPLQEAEVDVPEIGASEVLVRVAACGICHSDEHYRAGISRIDRLPVTLGHEIAGWIEKAGADIKHITRGDRVCVHYLAHCGSCEFCVRGLGTVLPQRTNDRQTSRWWICGVHQGSRQKCIRAPRSDSIRDWCDHDVFVRDCASCAEQGATSKPASRLRFLASADWDSPHFNWHELSIATDVYVVEINPAKLASAASMGAIAIDARNANPVEQIKDATMEKESMSHWN